MPTNLAPGAASPPAASPPPSESGGAGFARTARIVGFLLKYRSAGVFTGLALDTVGPVTAEPVEEGRPEQFVADLEALGPTFIKIGQALSTRPDLVPADYLKALERIQDAVAPVSFDAVREAIEQELGVKCDRLFAELDEKPLGSASLAQVHRARLRDGRAVAVKVQRPGIRELIHADLAALAGLADKADRYTDLGRRLRFSDWVHEFRKSILAELDYRVEADNLERFDRYFEGYPEISVPKPVWDLTRERLLTMELVEGVKASELSGLARTEQRLGALATALVRAYLDQVFVHGEIHADPHPGNVFVTVDGRLALLDLGMIAFVTPRGRERLLKLLYAAVDGRGDEVAQEVIALGTRLPDFDEPRYRRDVGQLVARYAATSGRLGATEGRLVIDLTVVGTACGLRIAPELAMLGKALLHLESVSSSLDPELDVKQVVVDHLAHVMRERMKQAFSPTRLASDFMEVQALVREVPRKLSELLSVVADNRLQLRLTGLEESRLVENLQKIANRVSTGIIVAALVIASAMLMRVEGGPRLLGYPAIAFVLFSVATALGLGIVASALMRDRKASSPERRGSP